MVGDVTGGTPCRLHACANLKPAWTTKAPAAARPKIPRDTQLPLRLVIRHCGPRSRRASDTVILPLPLGSKDQVGSQRELVGLRVLSSRAIFAAQEYATFCFRCSGPGQRLRGSCTRPGNHHGRPLAPERARSPLQSSHAPPGLCSCRSGRGGGQYHASTVGRAAPCRHWFGRLRLGSRAVHLPLGCLRCTAAPVAVAVHDAAYSAREHAVLREGPARAEESRMPGRDIELIDHGGPALRGLHGASDGSPARWGTRPPYPDSSCPETSPAVPAASGGSIREGVPFHARSTGPPEAGHGCLTHPVQAPTSQPPGPKLDVSRET